MNIAVFVPVAVSMIFCCHHLHQNGCAMNVTETTLLSDVLHSDVNFLRSQLTRTISYENTVHSKCGNWEIKTKISSLKSI